MTDSINDSSLEAKKLAYTTKHCSRGWFSGKRTLRKSPAHGPAQVNVLVHKDWDRLARNHVGNEMERGRKARKRETTKEDSSSAGGESGNAGGAVSLFPSASTEKLSLRSPHWMAGAHEDRAKHLDRTAEPSSGGIKHKRRLSASYLPRLEAEYRQRQDNFHAREKNRILGRTKTRSIYEQNLLALQEEELRRGTKDGAKGGVRCEYAMRTKIGNAARPCLW